ncbi:hypothetical protein G6F65_018849 [Rhizopus arrhizus]|nr:hypothetical protein G6F65_018849 [Rhizopus arrhizus]
MAQGGNVEFTGGDVVTRAGSQINLSGGTLDVQDGMVRQSWLRGVDGRLYEVTRAPGDLAYTGLYKGFEANSERWGQTRYFYNPLIAPRERFEAGYTVGRDAGRLVIGTRSAVLEGELIGTTFQGDRQNAAAQAGLDGYQQSQRAQGDGRAAVRAGAQRRHGRSGGAVRPGGGSCRRPGPGHGAARGPQGHPASGYDAAKWLWPGRREDRRRRHCGAIGPDGGPGGRHHAVRE